MVDRQGALYTMSEEKAQLHWRRSQAARFLLRWPSLHLCHVINRERHVSVGLHVAASLAPAVASQASLLHSLSSGTVPGTTAATNTTFAVRYSKNLPNTTEEAAVLTKAGKASAQAHVLSSRIASSFAAASASSPSSSSSPSPTISSLLHSPNSSLLETHVWVGRDGPRRVSVHAGGRVRSEGKGGSEGASEGESEGGGSSTSTMGRLCGATMMANTTTVDELIATIGQGDLLTLDPVTIALGGEPYLPRPIAAVHVSRGDEARTEGAGEKAGETAGETAGQWGDQRTAEVSQALQRLQWLNPNLRRVCLSGDARETPIQQHLEERGWALLHSTLARNPPALLPAAAAAAADAAGAGAKAGGGGERDGLGGLASAAAGADALPEAAVVFADLLTSSLADFLIADISTESGNLIHELRCTNGRLFSPVCDLTL
ncbi:unnamed protein product [Closterium sp. Naga37s-1]|nr:unnamed protein product [Closterium sp. Naga37s-1]